MAKKWYVIHTQTGAEEKVKMQLENKIGESEQLKKLISRILIPTEQISEVKRGKKKISERKYFPGYILLEMELNDDTWRLIRGISGVTRFIGAGKRPLPLKEQDVENILKQAESAKQKPTPKVTFEKGEMVRIIDGPFMNFNGTIEEVNPVKQKLVVSVSIFGRATPVELEYWRVEKI